MAVPVRIHGRRARLCESINWRFCYALPRGSLVRDQGLLHLKATDRIFNGLFKM